MDGAYGEQPHQHEPGHPTADERDATLSHALQIAPFALIVTNLHGIVRRVVCPVPSGDNEVKQTLKGRHIFLPFRDNDREFVRGVLQKLNDSETFSLECAPVWLHGNSERPVYLSVSPLPVSQPENLLIAWHVARDRIVRHEETSTDQQLLQRIEVLEARAETQRRRKEAVDKALQVARNSNHILSNALRTSREFQRLQAQSLKQAIEVRDELLERSNELAASAVEARVAADEARLRLRVLADASWALTNLLDVDRTLHQLSDLLVPAITDCLVVDLVDTDTHTLNHAVVSCRDPEVGECIQEHAGCRIADLNEDHPLQHVLSTGHPTVLHGLDTDEISWNQDAGTFIDHAADSGLTACIIVPLRSRDRTIGTLTLASGRVGHLYRPDDLQLAEDIALRTAQALDNAMLFQDVVQATKDRERYLSMASHELRSPLAVVSGFGSLMLRYIANPELDRDRILNVGREMQQGIERLEVLTSNLLASAEVDAQANGLQRRRADMVRIVHDVADRIHVTIPRDQWDRIEISNDSPVFGCWNLEGVERALTNVVSNALKYSSHEDRVSIEVSRAQDNAVVSVRDQGIGMTKEEMADLFVPFARGKEARATAIGTGLGMYIAQQIIRQHGGTVDVESSPGQGSLVTITLPLEMPHNSTPEPEETIRRIK